MCGPHVAQNRLNLTSARLWRTISPYPGSWRDFSQRQRAQGGLGDPPLVAPTTRTTHPPCAVVEGLKSSPGKCFVAHRSRAT